MFINIVTLEFRNIHPPSPVLNLNKDTIIIYLVYLLFDTFFFAHGFQVIGFLKNWLSIFLQRKNLGFRSVNLFFKTSKG